jgi:hypothetical protein
MERLRELVSALQRSDELARFAELARVPESKQEDFRILILRLLCDTWIRECRLRLTSKNVALSRAASTLRSAKQALADLDEHDRKEFWQPISEVENGIDKFLLLASGGFEVRRVREHRGGRRPGTVNNASFQSFAQEMFIAVEASGGRLTIEKNIGRGTVVKAIDILKPHLPHRFIPKQLPFSTLQRIKLRVSKAWRTSNQGISDRVYFF